MAIIQHHVLVNGLSVLIRENTPTIISQTVLILHGWNTTGAEKWVPFIEQFPLPHTRFITMDMPGFANSQDPKGVWNAERYADFVAEFLTQRTVRNITVVAHSFGGAVAVILAAKYPQLVEKMVLCAPAIVRSSAVSLPKNIIKRVSNIFKYLGVIPFIRPLWYNIIGSPDYHQTEGIMSSIMQQVIREDLQHWLPQVNQKTLLIWGKADTYTPYSQSALVLNALPNAELVTLVETNHGIHLNALPILLTKTAEFITTSHYAS